MNDLNRPSNGRDLLLLIIASIGKTEAEKEKMIDDYLANLSNRNQRTGNSYYFTYRRSSRYRW